MAVSKNRTSAEVLAEVTSKAGRIQKQAGGNRQLSMAAARAEVWRNNPELMKEHRKAQARERGASPVADESAKTINDRVREVIDEATRRASWQPLLEGWGDGQTREQIIAKVRVEVWRTPDGRELRDLDRAFGSKPHTPAATVEIRKSRGGSRFLRALNLLDSGIWEK